MLRCCIVCTAEESPDLQLQYCAACQSALYCSEACQTIDWRKQHKKICKLLNVGHGDMQVRNEAHTSRSILRKQLFEAGQRSFDGNEDTRRFFKLFKESTFEGSRAAARKMKKIAKRQTKSVHKLMFLHSLLFLARSDSEMLSWPNSPLLVLLQIVTLNVLTGYEDAHLEEGVERLTPLHHLADLADPSDHSTHVNQVILAKQLIEHGANVNAVSSKGSTPLHLACAGFHVTNLDFVELLLEKGADPNFKDHRGLTPLMYTPTDAPSAAKFLLNWPATDANIIARSGASFMARVRQTVEYFSDQIALPANPKQIQHRFLLQQWHDIEVMLMERGAHDTGITALS
jgi:hypothetical protein